MAWYDGKLWLNGMEWGPAVVDPATGALSLAIDYPPCRDFSTLNGEDIGVLPGGWVALGGWAPLPAITDNGSSLLLRSGAGGLPASDHAANVANGANTVPHLLRIAQTGAEHMDRQLPVWDAHGCVLPGGLSGKDKAPIVCPDLAGWLNAEDDAHTYTPVAENRLQWLSLGDVTRAVAPTALPAEMQRPALPDDWNARVNSKRSMLSGIMALTANAVIFLASREASWPALDIVNWSVLAVSRADRSVLWEVRLPPGHLAYKGLSVTREGDVLVPLDDGRVVCIGSEATALPVPAVTAANAQPGLLLNAYSSDAMASGYSCWSAGDFAVMPPLQTRVLTTLPMQDDKIDACNVLRLHGLLEVPTTGSYHVYPWTAGGGSITFTIYDAGGRHIVGNAGDEVCLAQGKHPISLVVLQGAKPKSIVLQWDGPNLPRGPVPASALWHEPLSNR